MNERLKQIWAGFEKTTTRRLTGRGVDTIIVPGRIDWRAEERASLAPEAILPAEAAFSALKTRLSAAGARAARKEERRAKADGRSFTEAPDPLGAGAPEAVRDLMMGLKATEARVERREIDYASYLATRPKGAPKLAAPRKKLFGIL
ncbi:MAG TPA: hypothetical protein DDZ68_09330 [Parvularcula sp.]|nr:hypothetical protein [Parvularcula sp.]HBS32343.1 hypothetical protein [Parvularcula sp.]